MSLDYDKLKQSSEENAASKLGSYSDLFMGLAFLFLLLYVLANVRGGALSVQKQSREAKLKSEVEDLRQQIKIYNTLKDDYLTNGAEENEKEQYDELMAKLSLLQDQAKKEKEDLQQQAKDNEKREIALNKYQQMIRNIINTNLLATARIKRRDKVIDVKTDKIEEQIVDINKKKEIISEQTKTIEENTKKIEEQIQVIAQNENLIKEKSEKIEVLRTDVSEKEKVINQNQKDIEQINKQLSDKIAQVNKAFKDNKTTKEKMNQEIARLKEESQKKIETIALESNQVKEQLASVNQELFSTNVQLEDVAKRLENQKAEKERLAKELTVVSSASEQMKAEHVAKMAEARAAFDNELKKHKLSAAARAKKEAEFRAQVQAEEGRLKRELANLGSEVNAAKAAMDKQKSDFEKQLAKEKGEFEAALGKEKLSAAEKAKRLEAFQADAKRRSDELQAQIANVNEKNQQIAKELEQAKKLASAKKAIAQKITQNLEKKGVKAEVDQNTGDVILSFGDDYFDTGAANLKESMKGTLKKFIPTYTSSLFDDGKISEMVESVEIVGFASPTYKGMYVDPETLEVKDRTAVSYNLDLSYQRAKSIFDFIFDTSKMKYEHQKSLLSLVKVTGRSFLADGVKGRDLTSGLSMKQYCKQYDCQKSQRVVVKFSLKDKKDMKEGK